MRKAFYCDLIFIILFLFFITVPNIHLTRAKISEKENRTLAVYKPLLANGKVNFNYGKDFESFYSDRFFTRKILLSLNENFKSRFMPPKENNVVLLGKSGWLFYRGDNSERNYANLDYFDDSQLKNILSYLISIDNWCRKNGKKFVWFIAPDKNKIYGEYYPSKIKKQNPDEKSRAFQAVEYIRNNSDVCVVYPYEKLIEKKAEGKLLYYKNDTHWNELGSYAGYAELCSAMKIEPLEFSGYDESLHETGDLNNLFPEGTKKDLKTVYHIPKIESSFSVLSDVNTERNGLYTECSGKSGKAVFFRDSFSSALSRYVSNTFSSVNYNWRYNILESDFEDLTNADVIVLETVERYIPALSGMQLPENFN